LAAVVPGYFLLRGVCLTAALCNIKKNLLDLKRFPLRPANSVLILHAGDRQKSLSLVDTQALLRPTSVQTPLVF
jgi:hypothetical protein